MPRFKFMRGAVDRCGVPARRLAGMARQIHVALGARDRESNGVASGDEGLLAWAGRYLPEHFRLEPSGMQLWLAAELDRMRTERGEKLNVIGPRGGAKSTVGTLALPLRAALERSEPYIWIVSDTQHQAIAHLNNLKAELIENRRLAADYPGAAGQGPVWRAAGIVLRNGVAIEAFGTGQKTRGRRQRENRPTLIICDDLQNDLHMESAALRDYCRRWFHGALLKAGTHRTNVIHLATALHREALALELSRTPGWTSRTFQAIVRWPAHMQLWEEWESIYCDLDNPNCRADGLNFYRQHRELMDSGAELLWPAEEDLYTLMCMRLESGRSAFEREKQSSPIHPDACEWPEEYFDERIWFERWPSRLRIKTMALDPSKGRDDRRGDYSAIVLLGVDEAGTVYIEADLARRPTPQIVADGVELYRRFQPDVFGVEANQFQDLLAADFEEAFRRQGLLAAQPCAVDNRTSKRVRIRRLGPYLSTRRLRFKSGSPGTQLLVNQLKDFPWGDHDDGPDAAEMALRLAAEALNQWDDGLGDRLV